MKNLTGLKVLWPRSRAEKGEEAIGIYASVFHSPYYLLLNMHELQVEDQVFARQGMIGV